MEPVTAGLACLVGRYVRDPEVALLFLKELWFEIAGDEVSRRAQPVGLEKGCLLLEVNDRHWVQPLRAMNRTLLAGIRKKSGLAGIDRIRIAAPPEDGVGTEARAEDSGARAQA